MLMHRTMTGLSERIPEAWDTRISSALVADGDHTRAEEFLRRTGASVQPGATVRQISTPESPKTAEICPWPDTRRPKRPTRGFGSDRARAAAGGTPGRAPSQGRRVHGARPSPRGRALPDGIEGP